VRADGKTNIQNNMEDKELVVDLDNLSKEDFLEMARYIQFLEKQVEELKTLGITLNQQRMNAERNLAQMKSQIITPITNIPKKAKLTDDLDLINPEQYRDKQ